MDRLQKLRDFLNKTNIKKSMVDFSVKEGDTGDFAIDEHVVFVLEEEAKELASSKSYNEWQINKRKIGDKGSIHSDFRIQLDKKGKIIGFTIGIKGGLLGKNEIINPFPESKIRVLSFKKQGKRNSKWLYKVGINKAEVIKPGDPGAPDGGGGWASINKVDKGRIAFGNISEHFIEMKIWGTKRVPEGRWILTAAPLRGERIWMMSYPNKQEFNSEVLEEIKEKGKFGDARD